MTKRKLSKTMDCEIYNRVKTTYKDFCPLCGSRFYGDTPERVYEQIIKHCDDGKCEKNFMPLDVALKDTGEDLTNGK